MGRLAWQEGIKIMAAKKNKDSKAWMIPEGEKRENATYHFVARKSISMIRDGKKLRMRKYCPKT